MSDDEVNPSDQLRVQRAVTDAEVVCGLSFTVVFCLGGEDLRTQAEAEFERLGLAARPAVLVLVEPVAGKFVIDLTDGGRGRLTDDDCAKAAGAMDTCYADTGDLAECVERGLELMCAAAGKPDEFEPAPAVVPTVLLTAAD